LNFGTATNMDCLIDQPSQFDFYDGGGLDAAFLGAAEADEEGNVNVSKFGPRFVGPGGFINISQNAKKVVFVGTFTAGGLCISIDKGRVSIDHEGAEKKFIKQVQQKTFSGQYAAQNHKPILYVTERCVFNLTEEGMELIEIAPGIDLQKDILDQMGFRPIIKGTPKLMDARIFRGEPMGLKGDLLTIPLEERLIYDAKDNIFFVNFENLYIRSRGDIEKIRTLIDKLLGPLPRKVNTIVNYDNFNILPELIDDYTEMINYVLKYYEGVTRYTTSAFLRMKMGEELEKRNLAPYIYESPEEARKALTKD
jgi:propionate CoA-transferase